ncbi:MAG: hypothetical protein AAGU21_08330 [Solidesulfovibrio sp.]
MRRPFFSTAPQVVPTMYRAAQDDVTRTSQALATDTGSTASDRNGIATTVTDDRMAEAEKQLRP